MFVSKLPSANIVGGSFLYFYNMRYNKIIYSTTLTTMQEFMYYEFLSASEVLDNLDDHYMYVNLISQGETYVSYFKDSQVQRLVERESMTIKDAVLYLHDSFGFFQEFRELLYWNGINSLKKYVPCTGEIRTTEGVEPVTEDECVFAKNEKEAKDLFAQSGVRGILYVIDLDE